MKETIYKEQGKAPCGARKLAGAGCLLLAGVLAASWLVGHLLPEVPGAGVLAPFYLHGRSFLRFLHKTMGGNHKVSRFFVPERK